MRTFIQAIIEFIKIILGKDKPLVPPIPPVIVVPLTLPHPEEASGTSARTIEDIKLEWFVQWDVPDKYIKFWNTVKIEVTTKVSVADTIAETKHMRINPQWVNQGVLAHEMAHISYALLTEQQKQDFILAYDSVIGAPLLVLLREQKPYSLTSMVEMHAEIYRYLGQSMMTELKLFYPKLF